MSAHTVSDDHISAILYAYARADRYTKRDERCLTEMGFTLLNANVASVAHRYSSDANELTSFTLSRKMRLDPPTAIAALKLCQNLNYQSCERDDWDGSLACKLLSRIERTLITRIPGYEEAPWEI